MVVLTIGGMEVFKSATLMVVVEVVKYWYKTYKKIINKKAKIAE
jgi:hypothetical protein